VSRIQHSVRVVVIGSGRAGCTAALCAAGADRKPLVFGSSVFFGGSLATAEVENLPGFPQGIQGPRSMDDMPAQAERFGAARTARPRARPTP
jgi:thioredoxin reductase (NADPH)